MGLPIAAIISTLGKILPGGATKTSVKMGVAAGVVAGITALVEPVNDLSAAIQSLTLAISGLIAVVAGVLGSFGVGRKAGATDGYKNI